MNNSNNTWIYENPLLKNKNQRYYYDFGTGKQVEREEVKEKRDAFLDTASKTSTEPQKQKKDDFLEGFNDPYGEKREQERKQKEQERKERLAKIRANADKRAWTSQSTTDPFLEGFNGTSSEENKWMRAVDTIGRVSRAYEDFQDKISPYVQKASLFSPATQLRFATDIAVAPLKNAHYSRNEKNVPVPKTIDEAKSWGWQIEDLDYCHNFDTPDISNSKYVPSDGGGEQIFNSSEKPVTSPENMPTYNFFHPSKEKFMHFLADVAPWVLWGNSPDDPTSMLERIVTPFVLQYYEENVLNRNGDSSGVSGR